MEAVHAKRRDALSAARYLLPLTLLVIGCGGPGDRRETAEEPYPDTLRLVPADTIGVDVGDSVYVFGMVLAAEADHRGRTLVLDSQGCGLSVYDAEGTFTGSAGTRGSGPGELQFPMDFAVLGDGGVVINDLQLSRLSLYGPDLEHRRDLAGFFPTAPMFLEGFHDSLFVAVDMSIDMSSDRPRISSRAGIWTPDSAGPRTVLASLDRPAAEMPEAGEPVEELTVAATDSLVFVGYQSVDRFLVEVYDEEGNMVGEISRPWERVEKTPGEMESSRGMAISVTRESEGGSSTEAHSVEDAVPWHNAIAGLGCDSRGRLWVRLGSRPFRPVFEVYDPRSGDLLFVALADSSLAGGAIDVSPGGIVHFDPDPEDYPKVIGLELAE